MRLLKLLEQINPPASRIDELYSTDVAYLKRFLSGDTHEIDGYYLWSSENSPVDPSMADWLLDHYPKLITPWMKKEGVDDPNELDPEYSQHVPLEPYQQYAREVGEDYVEYMMQHDPAEAPATAFYSSPRLIKRDTWLIHFSDNADDIAREGFKYGMDNMDKLGLTTYFKDTGFDKAYGGWNFAYTTDDREVPRAARENKYGSDAVIFTSAGVEAYHSGDDEHQVMFYGPHMDPRNIILLTNTGDGWCVNPHPSKWRTASRDCYYIGDDITDAIAWVEKNWRQYAKVIMGW